MTPRKLRWYLARWRYRRWCRKNSIPDPETLGVLVATGRADPELLGRQFGSWGDRVMAAGAKPGRRGRKSDLVADLMAFIRQYVVVTDAQLLVLALWVIHTYGAKAFVDQTPYLAVTSPEKKCGKSRLLEVLKLLAVRPWYAILPSEAVVYRHIHNTTPTFLLDEIDAIFNPRTAHHHEGLRAVLDAGHRRGALVPRCIGTSNKIVQFNVFCPKVVAGIGALPDTIADRSIPIRLERRTRDEKVEPFRMRSAEKVAHKLRERMEAWVEENMDKLQDVYPEMPEELDDRMQEGCESLAAIADALGIGTKARAALVELLTGERLDDQETMRLRLLRDIKTVFEAEDKRRNGTPARSVYTATLLDRLHKLPEAPWANYYSRLLDDRDLAGLLRPYGIRSTTVRGTSKKLNPAKGYKRDDFHAVWERYL